VTACLITLASLCILNPSEIEIRADVSAALGGDFRYIVDGRDMGQGYVGRIQLDVPVLRFRRITLSALAEHTSLVNTGRDRGQERVGLSITWRPF
jgi:hypothetical protein